MGTLSAVEVPILSALPVPVQRAERLLAPFLSISS
jgi:hypothetical protein